MPPSDTRSSTPVPAFGKLTGAQAFQRVRTEGRRLRANGFDLYVRVRDDDAGPRLGLAVSRKVGKAVTRNRWKRLIREYVRQQAPRLGAVDLVVVPRTPPPQTLWEFAQRFEMVWSRFKTSSNS